MTARSKISNDSLIKLMNLHHLSRIDVAALLHVSRADVSSWLNNKRAMPVAKMALLKRKTESIATAKTNNERLRELMEQHNLSRVDVARLLHKSVIKSKRPVKRAIGDDYQQGYEYAPGVSKWLATDKWNMRKMSDADIELLELKLKGRRKKAAAKSATKKKGKK